MVVVGGWRGGKGREAQYHLFTEKLVSLSPLFMLGGGEIPAGNFFQRSTDSIMWAVACFLSRHLHIIQARHMTANGNK